MQRKLHGQMSESFLIAGILSISGGLQDAYTYMYRGKVFANAQTGNIVLLAQNLVDRNWSVALRYFFPAFVLRVGSSGSGVHPYAISEGSEDPLAAAGACYRDSVAVCCGIFPE